MTAGENHRLLDRFKRLLAARQVRVLPQHFEIAAAHQPFQLAPILACAVTRFRVPERETSQRDELQIGLLGWLWRHYAGSAAAGHGTDPVAEDVDEERVGGLLTAQRRILVRPASQWRREEPGGSRLRRALVRTSRLLSQELVKLAAHPEQPRAHFGEIFELRSREAV